MNRRDLIRSLAVLPAVALVPPVIAKGDPGYDTWVAPIGRVYFIRERRALQTVMNLPGHKTLVLGYT